MKREILITDAAWQDIREAKEWYETRQEELGRRFWQHLQMALRGIQRSPLLGPASGSRAFRRRNLLVFPYTVFYELVGGEIRVHAVWHGSRDPKELKERLS